MATRKSPVPMKRAKAKSTKPSFIAKVKAVPHGSRAIRFTRSFNAPRELVFDAMTKPAMMRHWFNGPPGWNLITCTMDLRVGGKYRWVWKNHDGQEMGMGGVFKEVKRPERIVQTEKFDQAWYPGEALDTMVFTEQGKGTLMTLTVEYDSKATRDAVLASPATGGMEFGYQRLDQFLTEKQGPKKAKGKKENALFTGTSESDKVDEFMQALDHPLRSVAAQLRKLILSGDKSIGEGIFWNAPCFYYTGKMKPFDPKTYQRYIVGFNFFKPDVIRLIFLRGATVQGKSKLLTGDYKDGRRLALFSSVTDVKKHEKELKRIVKELVKNMNA